MVLRTINVQNTVTLFLTIAICLMSRSAGAASCKTQAQMTTAQRDELSMAARTILSQVQSGDVQALRSNTIPVVAAEFGGIASSVGSLKPLVQRASITVNALYALDATSDPLGAARTDFFCGTPLVVLNFTSLPPGSYALIIVHATGVPLPQQISLILSETAPHHWMLAGFFTKPMLEAGHDGLWYWVQARAYTQRNMNWNAWFYYRVAAYVLDPVEFLSSPNLEKLQHERNRIRPDSLPGAKPLVLDAHGSSFQVTTIEPTAVFGALDLEVHYTPDAAQAALLRDPSTARMQVTDVMAALLALHPELHDAFHGFWVQADKDSASLYSLELPMNQIASAIQPEVPSSHVVAP